MNTTLGTARWSAHASTVDPLQDHVGRDARLVLAHVGEQRATVDVADRVEPPAVDAGGAQLIVDRDRLARFEPDRVEPEVGGVGPPPDGDQQLVAGDRAPVVERHA